MSPALATVVLVSVVTIGAGALGLRRTRTTGDFYVASRAVTPRWNAAAIGGEYLSAASFLGVAGLILAYGYDALWYPVCYTAGYLILLAVVAAPLRRSGAYTLPDFAQIRLQSTNVRRAAGVLVVIIGWLYMVPQLGGASLTLSTQLGAPRWLGGLVVCLVVLTAVTAGGMRSITFAQAIQFWIKFLALLIPAVVLIGVWQHRTNAELRYPVAQARVVVPVDRDTTVRLPVDERLTVHGSVDDRPAGGPVDLTAGLHRLGAGTTVTLRRGDAVPVVARLPANTRTSWLTPLDSGIPHPLYASLSLILGVCLGTMGLPHVLVRFYTNSDGRDSRRTTFVVIVLLSLFYLLPTVFGTLARRFAPDLLLTGNTDATVLELPGRMLGGMPGVWLGALVTAGAFAAFLSTVSGLAVSVAGVLGQSLVGERRALRRLRIRSFRLSAVVALAVPYVVSLRSERLGLAVAVALAFTVAASTFCPLLVLGIWWSRLTDAGALAGMAVGGTLSLFAALATLAGRDPAGWPGAVLGQPAVWTVPISFAVMIVVSLASAGRVPDGAGRIMLRLHTPEAPVAGGR
ncbi:MAG TPA: cation acetate symporter [Actinoplanes sp.]|nr:cation acetate symporter [Actinoplanes sp.]